MDCRVANGSAFFARWATVAVRTWLNAGPVINAQLMARLIPNSTLRIFDGAGHLYLLTDAPEAAAIVRDFLATA